MKFTAQFKTILLIILPLLVFSFLSIKVSANNEQNISESIVGPFFFRLGELPAPITEDGTIIGLNSLRTSIYIEIVNKPEKVWVFDGDKNYELKYDPLTSLWFGFLGETSDGEVALTLKIKQSNGEMASQFISNIYFYKAGEIVVDDELNKTPSTVTLFYRKEASHGWNMWNGAEVGQRNPVFTEETGEYSFLLDKGQYYFEVKKEGYRSRRTSIFSISQKSVINKKIKLEPSGLFDFFISIFDNIEIEPIKVLNQDNSFQEQTAPVKQNYELFKINQNNNSFPIASITDNKKSVLSFWSSWNPDTLSQLLELEKINVENHESDFKVINIGLDNDYKSVEKFVRNRDYKLDTYSLENYSDITTMKLNLTPLYIFLDSEGNEVDIVIGRVLSSKEILDRLNNIK
jgi:thiol-disulfide isomerase/thioredoxin